MNRASGVWAAWLIGAFLTVPGCGPTRSFEDVTPVRAGRLSPSPVVAQVGPTALHLADVDPLASLAVELRTEMGLPAPAVDSFSSRLDLAVELVALSEMARRRGEASGEQELLTRRLLARVYLSRLLEAVEEAAVTPGDLEEVHAREVKRYLTTGESSVYRPSMVDSSAIVVGYYPDTREPEGAESVVADRETLRDLTAGIRSACLTKDSRGRAPCDDLDDFLELGRQSMRGHPTVRVQAAPRMYLDPDLPTANVDLHRQVTRLAGNGALSEPVWLPGGVYLFRRGVTVAGRGERPGDVKEELRVLLVDQRKEETYRAQVERLKRRYAVMTWPLRLLRSDPDRSRDP